MQDHNTSKRHLFVKYIWEILGNPWFDAKTTLSYGAKLLVVGKTEFPSLTSFKKK